MAELGMPPIVTDYLLHGLDATPAVLASMLEPVAVADRRWNHRPDPERFTLREMVAHLADWEVIFRSRMVRILREDHPALEGIDEERLAIDNDYASCDPLAQLAVYVAERKASLTFLHGLSGDQWLRWGSRLPNVPRLSISDTAVLMLGHDGYHLQQCAEWLRASTER
ncbi:MAG: DinB family protein [Armatimonadetes bacterium]|nr:DinB family protein [Armatimonadota bacterium]MDE2206757.1 DinB family protein [Armatimonadota bacterium]